MRIIIFIISLLIIGIFSCPARNCNITYIEHITSSIEIPQYISGQQKTKEVMIIQNKYNHETLSSSSQNAKYRWKNICLSVLCSILLIAMTLGIYLHRKYHFSSKQKLLQKDQEIALTQKKLYIEQEKQKSELETQQEIISSLHKKLEFIASQEEKTSATFLHTNILPNSEYDKFIHYFHISNPDLLNYLRTPDFKLTSYEIILCLLAYLNTPESHIECLLSKKHDALKKARQRIKNKMQITSRNSIGDFLREVRVKNI